MASDAVGGQAGQSAFCAKTFVEAVQLKYSSDCTENQDYRSKYNEGQPACTQIFFFVSRSPSRISESSETVFPSELILSSCGITHAGPVSELAVALSPVRELDISRNSVSQWSEVFSIIKFTPDIYFLNLSYNPLQNSGPVALNDLGDIAALRNISQIVLNGTKLSWDLLTSLLGSLPSLTEVHLGFNEYSTIDIPHGTKFPSLSDVYLSSNSISSWSELCRLGQACENMTSLVLMDNPISDINVPVAAESSADEQSERAHGLGSSFPKLKSLNLSRTQLKSLEDLGNLRQMPSLVEVKINAIPQFEVIEEKLRRQLSIGFLPNIAKLSGSAISADERDIAHRAFIRHYLESEQKPARYHELVQQVGELAPLANVSLGPATNTVSVKVHYNDVVRQFRFKLTATATDVKKILSSEVVDKPPYMFDMYYHDVGGPYGHELMAFMQRTLLSYKVKDDDEIYVQLKKSYAYEIQ